MMKNFVLIILLCFLSFSPANALAIGDDDSDDNTIEHSIYQFENKYNQDILLPKYLSFNPSYTKGNFNEHLRLVKLSYLNQESDTHLIILVALKREKLKKGQFSEEIILNDGTKAIYSHIENSDEEFLRFLKGDLYYYLKLSKNGKIEKKAELLKIANSLR